MSRPADTDYPVFFKRYVDLIPEQDIFLAFEKQGTVLTEAFAKIPVEKTHYAYASGKWTVAQMWQHVIDAERIFGYRALCIARGETSPLPGFDENAYSKHAPAAHRTLSDISEEMLLVRQSSLRLLHSFTEVCWHRAGISNDNHMTVLGLAFIMAGHLQHHLVILKEKYL
jgi:hypothetical protein